MPEYINEEQQLAVEFETEIQQMVKIIQEGKMPDWWMSYAGQLAYNLQVHTKGLMFDKVTGLYPNEHPDSQRHCINSYESITKGSIWKAINNIIRVFNNSSYNIQISEKTRSVIEQYQDSEGSLFSQFLEDWIKYAVASDPNGICVTYPLDYTDDLYRYVCYKDLIKVSDDVLVFKSEVESEKKYDYDDAEYGKEIFIDYAYVDTGQLNVRHTTTRTFNRRLKVTYINTVYHVFTKEYFIRFYKDKPGDTEFKYDYYRHPAELETLPYFENGGVEIEKDLYESFVQPFVPFGNLALMSHRNHRAVDLMFSYPKMSEVQQPCDTCNATGKEACADYTGVCRTCRGSMYITIQSPYKTYRKVHDSFDADNKVFSTPSVEYYSPDTAILDYSKNQWKDYLSDAEMAVFVQQKTETGNVEAAKSKELDREELYAWLSNISKVFYNNLQMFLQYLENYINPNPMPVSVIQPYSFAILTESEAFEALNIMLASSAPVILKASQIDNFVSKFISESSPVKRALEILKQYDLLLYYSDDAVGNLKGNAFVSSKMCQQHTLAYPVLIQMYEMDKKLFDLEDEAIIAKLSVEVDKYDLTKDLKTSIIGGDNNNKLDGQEIGKVPLALQQLALAKQRSIADGDQKLADAIENKMKELINGI